MEIREIDNRLAEIRTAGETAETAEEIESLIAEAKDLQEQRQALIDEREKQAAAILKAVNIKEEREAQVMENVITRNSPEYINAYAEAIKNDDFKEVRSLLTENANGTVAVPEVVENYIRAAWERNEIWNRIPKSYLKGNYKVQFEASGELAVKHEEGTAAIAEENLVLGIAELKPVYFKKYVKVSDEAMSLTGTAFLQYIYGEITNKIISAILKEFFAGIAALPATATATAPGVATITGSTAAVDDIINAVGALKGDLSDVVIMISRSAYAQYRALQLQLNAPFDIFDGLDVLYTDQLPTGVRAIVGSLADGSHANLPNGPEVEFKIDDSSIELTSADMVAILGRMFVGVGVVRDGAFCVIGGLQ